MATRFGYDCKAEIQSLAPRNCATFYPMYGCSEQTGEPPMLVWAVMDSEGKLHRHVDLYLAENAWKYVDTLHLITRVVLVDFFCWCVLLIPRGVHPGQQLSTAFLPDGTHG
jgi:hypothetical protein